MSLSKEQSNEDNYRRDSFDDRVCDDLSEVLLKYLSLKDRLRLECVSKQFQRSALVSQCLDYLVIPSCVYINIKPFIQMFKKFPNLNKLELLFSYLFEENTIISELIEEIFKNCNNLTHIEFNNSAHIKEEDQKKLFDKFGHQLISIINYSPVLDFTFTSAPNIEELIIDSFDPKLSQIEFKRLKRFNFMNLWAEDSDSFGVFIENNAKTLKHLDITYCNISDKNSAKRLLKIVMKAINLIHLWIDIDFKLIDNSFNNYWKQIAIKCKQIKSLKHYIEVNESLRLNEEMLSILKQFKRLKRLDLQLYFEDFDGSVEDLHPFEELKGLEGLTHFSIDINFIKEGVHAIETSNKTFNETLLIDIDNNLPKLQYLWIECPFIASEWTSQVLSRLSSLETIKLKIRNREIRPQIERQLIENCKHLRSFCVYI